VNSSGLVTAKEYGVGNMEIPEGGYVLSGNGAGSTILSQKIKIGDKIHLDYNLTIHGDNLKNTSSNEDYRAVYVNRDPGTIYFTTNDIVIKNKLNLITFTIYNLHNFI
jgi:hypothetical protein